MCVVISPFVLYHSYCVALLIITNMIASDVAVIAVAVVAVVAIVADVIALVAVAAVTVFRCVLRDKI